MSNGLSLCIQGTYPLLGRQLVSRRFIPVYTGNIGSADFLIQLVSVYPCVYREHSHVSQGLSVASGLSLCIQGTLFSQNFFIFIFRFIPVYTGNIKN